jgi:hypothetical protein
MNPTPGTPNAPSTLSTPIIYLFFGTGSGTLGTTSFNNAEFVVTVPTDSSRIFTNGTQYPPGTPVVDSTRPMDTVTVIGFGTTAFQFSLILAVLPTGNLFRVSLGLWPKELLGVASAQLQGYGLDCSIGPVSGTASFSPQTAFPTMAGDLIFSSIASLAFRAIVPFSQNVTEPPTNLRVAAAGAAHQIPSN